MGYIRNPRRHCPRPGPYQQEPKLLGQDGLDLHSLKRSICGVGYSRRLESFLVQQTYLLLWDYEAVSFSCQLRTLRTLETFMAQRSFEA